MRLTLMGAAAMLAALSLTAPAWADDPPSGRDQPLPADDAPPARWGLHSGDTVPRGDLLLYGEAGWPDVSLGFQRGIGDNLDIGVRASLILGVNYILPRDRNGVEDLSLGLGFTAPIRLRLFHDEKISVLVHADPGIRFDYFDPKPFWGPQIPVGIDLGVHVTERTTVTLGVDVPFAVRVSPDPTFIMPFLPGVSVERRFTDHFGMSVNLRPGILYGLNRTGSSVDLALLSQMGFFGRI